jgi:hypothetical protein
MTRREASQLFGRGENHEEIFIPVALTVMTLLSNLAIVGAQRSSDIPLRVTIDNPGGCKITSDRRGDSL